VSGAMVVAPLCELGATVASAVTLAACRKPDQSIRQAPERL
jgi:hypothetical protein